MMLTGNHFNVSAESMGVEFIHVEPKDRQILDTDWPMRNRQTAREVLHRLRSFPQLHSSIKTCEAGKVLALFSMRFWRWIQISSTLGNK